jgi:transposase InsO family protein
LVGVIDCCDRELVGWEFALRGRAKEAERAIEEAYIRRFGTLRPRGSAPTLRSDNGLIFQSRRFRSACRDYHLKQEFITPYTCSFAKGPCGSLYVQEEELERQFEQILREFQFSEALLEWMRETLRQSQKEKRRSTAAPSKS